MTTINLFAGSFSQLNQDNLNLFASLCNEWGITSAIIDRTEEVRAPRVVAIGPAHVLEATCHGTDTLDAICQQLVESGLELIESDGHVEVGGEDSLKSIEDQLAALEEGINQFHLVECPSCRRPVPVGYFCPYCGGAVNTKVKQCPKCEAVWAPSYTYCPECGEPLVETGDNVYEFANPEEFLHGG
ncbi:MAG TPA: zinc ribbon domain-containing protein [Candidatus Lokiarchaeia archaeon]|nr:zinc ribbon domain-containing protein [Candidatus Lokiarchaeia archaeon]